MDEKIYRWYIVHTYSGYEEKVKKSILERAKAQGLEDKIAEIVVPTREVVELKKGKRVQSQKKVFPGYILIKMILDDDTWYLVRRTPWVTGFVGTGRKPTPIPEEEVQEVLDRIASKKAAGTEEFVKGDYVKVIDGPFENFTGVVDEVYPDKQKLRVLVSIFGRSTPVELDYLQVEKL
ncbi:transcriptional antiterminator NusG [Thermosulfidibacter takaii ABI70S6]|uniref:Transcription termination/antitermination protein NusG n=1 Tax=Thermosulfidibacter takaii (strain DSM 17441 / JCM 13301 / NBRC 103674 / ABI70S6) TaxID=1298851 RepID=A0A0S3QV92_THET7|nr:transcription termination/antitermination protein NusG [Thermosulfidibacter takaii]BAT72234.1 transcriptional antiterminator NusG [Thermosulfidibacter takaii ABI70S6]